MGFAGLFSPTANLSLSTTSAVLLSTAVTSSYLGSIYLHPATRINLNPPTSKSPPPPTVNPTDPIVATPTPPLPPLPRDRNHPTIIKLRLLAVSISTALSLLSVPFLLSYLPPSVNPRPATLDLLGLTLPTSLKHAARLLTFPLGLTAALFTGSLFVSGLAGDLPGQSGWTWTGFKREYFTWQALRNFVVGPITEELVFRSCIVAFSYLAGFTPKQIIFISPLYFGIAHVHHAYETYVGGGRTRQSLITGILASTFQFTYTTLFGWYATYLFLRTGSVYPPILAHTFCNIMGLPPLGWAFAELPEKKTVILSTYVVGIATFVWGFARWTQPALYGGSLYWP